MFQLVKYELRGKLLTLLAICLTVIMGNLFLMTKIDSWQIGATVFSGFLGGGAVLLICFFSLTLMSDYLYDEQGYLLFTLPQSGMSILVSRLLAAVIQISTVALVAVLMFCLLDQGRVAEIIMRQVGPEELLYSILMHLWTIVSGLTFIYFCMVAGKVALRGKNVGKVGSLIIFFVLSIAKTGLTAIIANSFPREMEFHSLIAMTMNMGSMMLDVAIFAVLFMATSYLLEHKVDL